MNVAGGRGTYGRNRISSEDTGMSIQSINPATGETIETFQETTPQELERILGSAQAAFHEWRAPPFPPRPPGRQKAAGLPRARRAPPPPLMAPQMGETRVHGAAAG